MLYNIRITLSKLNIFCGVYNIFLEFVFKTLHCLSSFQPRTKELISNFLIMIKKNVSNQYYAIVWSLFEW